MTADPTPTPVTPEPLPVRWKKRADGPALVLGDGDTWWTVLAHRNTADEVVNVYGPRNKSLGFDYGGAIRSSLAAALTPPPTPAEIADHIDKGGHIQYRRAVGCVWSGVNHLGARWWRLRPDQNTPVHGYRLVPLPPEPSYEVVDVPWWEARGEVFAEEVGGKYHSIVFVCDGESGGPTVSLSNGYIARASDGGTVPVRRERKS